MSLPAEFEAVLGRARTLTYEEGFALSRHHERSPNSSAGRARTAFDRIVKERGLNEAKSEWLGAAGGAVIEAISSEPYDDSHAEGWRWGGDRLDLPVDH